MMAITLGRVALYVAMLWLVPVVVHAQVAPVTIVDAGPGFMAQLVRAALASPHVLIPPGDTAVHLARGASYPSAVIVLGRDATVASRVRGDVIVVDGDLYLRPGAEIQGRAVAIGGSVVNSSLASVRDGRLSYRDETFIVTAAPGGGWELRYRQLRAPSPQSRFPLLAGLALPTYDRINGLSLGFAPSFEFDSARIVVRPAATYRSHLGVVDPSLQLSAELGRRNRAELWAGRGTFTNDAWIYSDMVNSALALVTGKDMRNWFRGARIDARAFRRWEGARWEHEPWIGGRLERAESVVRDTGSTAAPWSLFGRSSLEGLRRPNPPVDDGRLVSALVGTKVRWEPADVRALGTIESEVLFGPAGRRAVQTTVDARIEFPAVANHTFRLETHGVATAGDASRQRYAFLGGSGTGC